MADTVEESLAGFRRFTEDLLRIKDTEKDPVRAFEAVKDWSRRWNGEGVWPVLDINKQMLVREVHRKFSETDVWTRLCEAQQTVSEWLIGLLGGHKFDRWTLIRSEKEWGTYILCALASKQCWDLLDFHKVNYEGPSPKAYPCLAVVEQRSCDTWPEWWEADFVYEADARALIDASGQNGT